MSSFCGARLSWALVVLGFVSLFLGAGCKDSECSAMVSCCQQVKDLDGVGQACGPLAEQARDPQTCRDIKRTIHYMLQDRKQPIPAACQ